MVKKTKLKTLKINQKFKLCKFDDNIFILIKTAKNKAKFAEGNVIMFRGDKNYDDYIVYT